MSRGLLDGYLLCKGVIFIFQQKNGEKFEVLFGPGADSELKMHRREFKDLRRLQLQH